MEKKRGRQILIAALLAAIFIITGVAGLRLIRGQDVSFPFPDYTGKNLESEVAGLTEPVEIAAGDGSGSYYEINPDKKYGSVSENSETVYDTLTDWMTAYMENGGESEKINETEFMRAASGRTVTAVYSCDIPFNDFMRYNGIRMPGGDSADSVTRLVFSEHAEGALLIYDGRKNGYYRVLCNDKKQGITAEHIDKMVSYAQNSGGMRSVRSGILTGKGEFTYLPDAESASVTEQSFVPEYDRTSRRDVSKLETIFFPGGMDFVHRVESADGSITYMYGSRQKVLCIFPEGGFSYTEDAQENRLGRMRDRNFYCALSDAVKYIKDHGGWISGDNVELRLSNVEKLTSSDSSRSGYRFAFCLESGGMELMYSEGSQLSVEIREGSVTAYRRDLPDTKKTAENEESPDKESGADGTAGRSSAKKTEQSDDSQLSLSEIIYENRETLVDALGVDDSTIEKRITDDSEESRSEESVLSDKKSNSSGSNKTEKSDPVTESEKEMYAEAVLDGLSAARPCLYRSESSGSDSASDRQGKKSEKSEDLQSEVNSELAILPAWYIKAGNQCFWFNASSGELLARKTQS